MSEIIPGILEHSWEEIEKKLSLVSSLTNSVHIDLLDGTLAPNTTFLDPAPFAPWAQKLDIELHMMVSEPITFVEAWGSIGVKRFMGHIEQMSDQEAFIKKAREFGEGGLALDGKTPLSSLTTTDLDALLLMTIDLGFSGKPYVSEYAKKCSEAAQLFPHIVIGVDGGIHLDTITDAFKQGARRFTVTSAFFGTPDPVASYQELLSSVVVPNL